MISQYQHQENIKKKIELESKGYRFMFSSDGYMVWLGEKFLGGASGKLPREKALHWKHARANIQDNLEQCLLTIRNSDV